MRILVLLLMIALPASATVETGTFSTYSGGAPVHFGTLYESYGYYAIDAARFWPPSTDSRTPVIAAGVYDAGVSDPLTVEDASIFAYSEVVQMWEDGTVFFRGDDGTYGAWVYHLSRRTDEAPGPAPPYPIYGLDQYMTGTWYYQNDGSANFTPEPGTGLLVAF